MDYVWLLWLYEDVCMVDSKAVLNPVMVVSVVVIASAAHCTPLTSSLTSSWPTSVWLTPTNIHTWFVPLFRIFTFLLFLHVSFFKFFVVFFLLCQFYPLFFRVPGKYIGFFPCSSLSSINIITHSLSSCLYLLLLSLSSSSAVLFF